VVTIIDGLQAILAAKTALPSAHTIIKPTGCDYPFDIVVDYSVSIASATITVVASDIDGVTLASWSAQSLLSGSKTCDIPAGTDKIVATVNSGWVDEKTCHVSAYYATFS
jgi:hypothetical protein